MDKKVFTPEEIEKMRRVSRAMVDQLKGGHPGDGVFDFEGKQYLISFADGIPQHPSPEDLALFKDKAKRMGYSEDELIKMGFPPEE